MNQTTCYNSTPTLEKNQKVPSDFEVSLTVNSFYSQFSLLLVPHVSVKLKPMRQRRDNGGQPMNDVLKDTGSHREGNRKATTLGRRLPKEK